MTQGLRAGFLDCVAWLRCLAGDGTKLWIHCGKLIEVEAILHPRAERVVTPTNWLPASRTTGIHAVASAAAMYLLSNALLWTATLGVLLHCQTARAKKFELSREGLEILLQEISPECNVEIQREIDQGVSISPHCELHIEKIIEEVGALRNIGPNTHSSRPSKLTERRVEDVSADSVELQDNYYINAAGADPSPRRDRAQNGPYVQLLREWGPSVLGAVLAVVLALWFLKSKVLASSGAAKRKRGKKSFKVPKRRKG